MENPEVSRGRTPSGGDYAELWYLDKDGNPVDDKKTATQYRILELTNAGEIVQTTYGIFEQKQQKGG